MTQTLFFEATIRSVNVCAVFYTTINTVLSVQHSE